ncbi:MAG: hypothetical protein WD187_01680 [Candidatus Woykebacteria bacterium]
MSESVRDVLRKLAQRQARLERLRNLGAPDFVLKNEEELVKRSERKLWEMMDPAISTENQETPPMLGILGRETLFARCEALIEELLDELLLSNLIQKMDEMLEKRVREAGMDVPMEIVGTDEEITLFQEHAPQLFEFREMTWEVYFNLKERPLTQKWEEARKLLNL